MFTPEQDYFPGGLDENFSAGSRFQVVRPQEPLTGLNFEGAYWADLTLPAGLTVDAEGIEIAVTVFGIQELRGEGAGVKQHFERMYELVYPLSGTAVMTIGRPDEEPVAYEMNGPFNPEELGCVSFDFTDGRILARNGGNRGVIEPVVTPAGGTQRIVGEIE